MSSELRERFPWAEWAERELPDDYNGHDFTAKLVGDQGECPCGALTGTDWAREYCPLPTYVTPKDIDKARARITEWGIHE